MTANPSPAASVAPPSGSAAQAPPGQPPVKPSEATTLTRVWGLTKREAEELLDWLEAQAIAERGVSYTEGKGFCVCYRRKA